MTVRAHLASKAVFWKDVDGHFVAHLGRSERARVNPVGYHILEQCSGRHSLDEIASAVAARYGQEVTAVREQVEGYLADLQVQGFVHLSPPAATDKKHTVAPHLNTVYLSLTARCNLRCRFCYAGAGQPQPDELLTGQWLEVLDDISGLSDRQGSPVKVVLTGGEPLLSPGFRAIAQHAHQLGCPLELYTNGTLISESMADFLAGLNFVYVGVSIDGARPETHDRLRGVQGSFERALAGLQRLVQRGVEAASWQMVVCRPNLDELPLVVEEVARLGGHQLQLGSVDALGRAARAEVRRTLALSLSQEVELRDFVTHVNQGQSLGVHVGRMPCGDRSADSAAASGLGLCGLTSLCHVNPRGDVTLCPALWDEPFVVGHVLDTELSALWQDDRLWAPLRHRAVEDLDDCHQCGFRNLCRGGCRANAYYQSGSLLGCEENRWTVFQSLAGHGEETPLGWWQVPRRTTELWRRHEDGSATVLGIGGRLVRLNASAFVVWRLVDGRRTTREIVTEAGRLFEQSGSAFDQEITEVLHKMEDDELVVLDWTPL